MSTELFFDHVFILTEPNAPVAEALLQVGFAESQGRVHAGQGTANRRFEFANGMLEFLWVHDEQEAMKGPACGLRFVERTADKNASPFGIIVTADDPEPYTGWRYQPEFFPPPKTFLIGGNSEIKSEPLCICSPLEKREGLPSDPRKFLKQLTLTGPHENPSDVLRQLQTIEMLEIATGPEHLMELAFDEARRRLDLRPAVPLVIHY